MPESPAGLALTPPEPRFVRFLPDEAAAIGLGARLSAHLQPGQIIHFSGELGAGKTTLIRGILAGIGHRGEVRSPTYNLMQVFGTKVPIVHADLYRLSPGVILDAIGISDYLDTHACLIEWPERLAEADSSCDGRIHLEPQAGGRQVTISGWLGSRLLADPPP